MNLFLASQSKHPKTLKAIKKFIVDKIDGKVVYIPTAANAEEGFGKWKTGSTFNTFKNLFTNLEVLELEFTTNEDVAKKINSTDILFVGGGLPVYLNYWIYLRGLNKLLPQRLKEGMLYIGSSAGAMVCGPSFKIAALTEIDSFSDLIPGLGLVDYEIIPHFKDEYTEIIEKSGIDVKYNGLKDGEHIVAKI